MKAHLIDLFKEILKDYEGKDINTFIDVRNEHPGKLNVSAQLVEFGDARTFFEEAIAALQVITNADLPEGLREANIPIFNQKIQAVIDLLEAPEPVEE